MVCVFLFCITHCLYFSLCNFSVQQYTGSVQTFTAPHSTSYKCECWGASGGIRNETVVNPGSGGYTFGIINFQNNYTIYIYVGNSNIDKIQDNYSFNGGAPGEAPGGGATDIRLTNGNWKDFNSLKSRIMVAGGGGGGFHNPTTSSRQPGHAGGLSGISANCKYTPPSTHTLTDGYSGEGGKQTRGGVHGTGEHFAQRLEKGNGSFGYGGYGYEKDHTQASSSGGGGGYYGGGHGVHPGNGWTGGGGGSSFISGHTGCNAISSASTSTNIVHTGQPNHYSGYVFTNTVMKAGNEVMPSPTGGTETGHSGNGYCKITWHPTL